MKNLKIKGVLVDFDQTLFDTYSVRKYWKQAPPDWKTVYSKIPDLPLFEGWNAVLPTLKKRPFGIVSGNTKTFISKVIKYHKVQVPFVISRYGDSGQTFRPLPKTKLFEYAMQRDGFKNLSPEEVIYLGDEASDVEAAKEFGFLSGGCFWGTKEGQALFSAKPTVRLTSPRDLLPLLTPSRP